GASRTHPGRRRFVDAALVPPGVGEVPARGEPGRHVTELDRQTHGRLPLGVDRWLCPQPSPGAARPPPVRSAVDAQAHGALRLALVLLLPQGVALVVLLLAAGEGDEDLRAPPDGRSE